MKTDLKVFSTWALDFTPSFASLYVKYYSLCSWRRPNDNPAHKLPMVSVDLSSRQFSFFTCLILFVFLLLCDI